MEFDWVLRWLGKKRVIKASFWTVRNTSWHRIKCHLQVANLRSYGTTPHPLDVFSCLWAPLIISWIVASTRPAERCNADMAYRSQESKFKTYNVKVSILTNSMWIHRHYKSFFVNPMYVSVFVSLYYCKRNWLRYRLQVHPVKSVFAAFRFVFITGTTRSKKGKCVCLSKRWVVSSRYRYPTILSCRFPLTPSPAINVDF